MVNNLNINSFIKYDRIVVPVQLIIKILKEKKQKEFQAYLLLKIATDGVFKLSPELLEFIQLKMGYSTIKSVRNQLKRLEGLNWIGLNKKTGWYHQRSMDKLTFKYGITSCFSCVFFPFEYDNIEAFLYGSVIGYLARRQKRFKWDFSGREKRRPLPKSLAGFYPAAISYIAKIFCCSLDTAFRWRNIARDAGLLEVNPQYKSTEITSYGDFKFARTNGEEGRRLRKVIDSGGEVYYGVRCIDLIRSNGLVFRRRKKNE